MSRLVAFAAIQGGYNIVSKVEGRYKRALETYDADTKVGFPWSYFTIAPIDLVVKGLSGLVIRYIIKLEIV